MILSNWKKICLLSFYRFIVAASANEEVDEILVMPDAGRSIKLGEFYDARSNTVVPGRLWNMNDDKVKDYVYESPASFTSVDFTADEGLQALINLLKIGIQAAFKYTKAPSVEINIAGSFCRNNLKNTS